MGNEQEPPEGNAVLFNQYYDEIVKLVERRKSKWILSSPEWEDVASMLTTHVWQKIHLYDTERPFDRWCNVVLTNCVANLLRDRIFRNARPCLASSLYGTSCVFNLGENQCGWTPTGHQDETCPLFKAWKEKKGQLRSDIAAPLSLESHADEHHSIPSDFIDYDHHKTAIDKAMLKKLSKGDARLYRLLYIRHLSVKRVMKEMGLKSSSKTRTAIAITKARNRFIKMAKTIISELDIHE